MKSIKGTLTEQNLLKSFAGESQARTRYNFFASVAHKEGYEQIAAIFNETAEQEKEHAKRFFKFLEGGLANVLAPQQKISLPHLWEKRRSGTSSIQHLRSRQKMRDSLTSPQHLTT